MRALTVTLALLVTCLAVPTTPALAAPASATPASATPASATPASATPADCAAPTAGALADYFDHAVPSGLQKYHVPGTVVSVVSGDHTAFAKGYGLADAEHGVAFDPDRSLVRLASITKLFTWTAVMQQVQAGRLDLHTDVNHYLTAFKIPRTYPQPVTLQDLMDHTAGFEDRVIGTVARTAADVIPLERFLASEMPARIRPPGQISAYSNYGAALAGYLVAKVSGQPYDKYVTQHLLAPLQMTHSTATEPVPAPLAAGLARSYNSDDVPLRRVPFIFDPLTPDGAISATAADMAHFMIAQLNDGRYGDAAILSPAATARMHQRSFAADPRTGGYAHGFMDRTINGRRVLMHDGGWEGFVSALILIPGCHLGLFVSANATGGADSATPLIPGFFDRFAPTPATSEPIPTPEASTPATTTAPLAGFYEPTRHNESTIEKVVNLLGPRRLTVDGDGTVHFKGTTWTKRSDGVYRPADDSDQLVFLHGADGRHYAATDIPAYQLMSAGETLTTNLVIVVAFVVIALSALIVILVGLERRLRRRTSSTTVEWRRARTLAAGAAVLGLAYLAAVFFVLLTNTRDFIYSVPVSFQILLGLPFVVLLLAGAAAIPTIRGWRGSGAGLTARIHHVVVYAGLAALIWFTWQWNLIGWQF